MEDVAAALGAFMFGFMLLAGAATVFWMWSLLDLLKRPSQQWEQAEQNKYLWLTIIVISGAFGSFLYLALARPSLARMQAASQVVFDPTAFGVPAGGLTYGEGGFQPPAR